MTSPKKHTCTKQHSTPVHNSVNVWCNVSQFLCLLNVFLGLRPTAHFQRITLLTFSKKSTCKKKNVSFHQSNKRDWNNYYNYYTSWLRFSQNSMWSRGFVLLSIKNFPLLKREYFSNPKAGRFINYSKNHAISRPFPSSPAPLYQNEVKCSAFDMEMIFQSHANKTHFPKKGCALGLILNEGFWNSEVTY